MLAAASDVRYPAAYQLLPLKGEPFAWMEDAGGVLGDIYDKKTAAKLGLVEANLAAASGFHSGLDLGKRPAGIRYFCFAGTRQKTTTHVLLRGEHQLRGDAIEEEDGGDGTVPTWSAFLPRLERQFVGGEHGTIYQDYGLRSVLATLLGKPKTLAGVPPRVAVTVRDRVVEPDDEVHVTINFGKSIFDFSGVLTVERAQVDPVTGKAKAFDAPIDQSPVTYRGAGMEYMSLTISAPDFPGSYRVSFRDSLAAPPSGFDELIVQQPM